MTMKFLSIIFKLKMIFLKMWMKYDNLRLDATGKLKYEKHAHKVLLFLRKDAKILIFLSSSEMQSNS